MEHHFSVNLLMVLLSLSVQADGSDTQMLSSITIAEAESRAKQTVQGLFHYYWRQDPQAKQIGFFFACGQIGGEDSGESCVCENTASCTNCYRWWDAIAMESVATYSMYTNSKNHSNIADTIFAHSPYNSNWPGSTYCTFIDDFAWYGIAYLRVYEWLKVYSTCFASSECQRVMLHLFSLGSQVAEAINRPSQLGLGVWMEGALWGILVDELW